MGINTFITIAISATVGAGINHLYNHYNNATKKGESKSKIDDATHISNSTVKSSIEIAPWGLPSYENVKSHNGFINGYDRRTRNPVWGCEHLSKRKLHVAVAEKAKRKNKFKSDHTVPEIFRIHLNDYHKSGYDRGHLVPAADLVSSQTEMDDSFLLTNISPQVGKGLNRDYWSSFEHFVRELTSEFEDVYVTTGPLFIPTYNEETKEHEVKYKLIGKPIATPNKGNSPPLAVPTHFFKVIVAKVPSKSSRDTFDIYIGSFVIPNEPIDPKTNLKEFLVPLKDIESWSGLLFFPELQRDGKLLNDNWKPSIEAKCQPKKVLGLCDEVKCELHHRHFHQAMKN